MKRIDLSPFELQVFLVLVETGSFRAVAHHFALSQPAVSRAVARIEQRIGARLFDRTSRSVALTPQGEALLPIARRVIHDLTTSLDEITQSLSAIGGHVAIAALPSIASAILPPLFARLRRDDPEIRLSIIDTLLDGVTGAVAQGEVDFGIAVEPSRRLPDLVFEPLTTDRFVAVLSARHALISLPDLSWADLATHPVVAMRSLTSVRQLTDEGFASAGCAVVPAFEVSHLASAGALVAAGLGVTALPELALKAFDTEGIVTRPLTAPVVHRAICLVQRRGRTLSPTAALVRQRLLMLAP
ncbi:LysR family transcriptional regulator [Aureimonas phyllosphaerae]|uniref:LysR family transcriptional regulator n=1 Tax=Aureimonas phyllosphaerae TaxID=1166078 RepID=UPI003A5C5F17